MLVVFADIEGQICGQRAPRVAKKIDTVTMAVDLFRSDAASLLIVSYIPEGNQGRPLQVTSRRGIAKDGKFSYATFR